jgi:hypothetical protein
MADVFQLINPPGPITCLAYNKDRTCTRSHLVHVCVCVCVRASYVCVGASVGV